MAPKKSGKNRLVAKVVTGKKLPCSFCHRDVDDEITYGKLYAIGDIQCHYFCVLLSSCLIQKGRDEDGLFGFLYDDIVIEIDRAKKHKCSYCSRGGANLGCSVAQCRKQFHLPCGRERNAVSLFYGNYKSFCQLHAPKQTIPPSIMVKAKERMISDGKIKKKQANFKDLKELSTSFGDDGSNQSDTQSVCVICYETVDGYPTLNTFWPPCCARDAWFHRNCLQRMALSAGMHYLKCPLCNDKDNFYKAVVSQGYYVPDRDAAWELEQNAFAEIYEREVPCSADECLCPKGRSHDADSGRWSVRLCLLCGSSGAHGACLQAAPPAPPAAPPAPPAAPPRAPPAAPPRAPPAPPAPHVCRVCAPAAPPQLQQLATTLQAVMNQEQRQSSRPGRGPVMPARMSLRRTKRLASRHAGASSSSSSQNTSDKPEESVLSRRHLNLSTPKRPSPQTRRSLTQDTRDPRPQSKQLDFKTDSPTKILEESLKTTGREIDESLVDELRRRFRKPKPLSEKRKIVNDILNGVFDNLLKETKQKEALKRWCSPKKCDITHIKQEEIVQQTPMEVIEIDSDPPPAKKEKLDSDYCTTPKKPKKLNPSDTNIYPMFISPNKSKTVDNLKDSSLEISAKDEIVNIDVIKLENTQNCDTYKKMEVKTPQKCQTCTLKFSPNKQVPHKENIDMDVESFKDQYLNEVGLQRVAKSDSGSVRSVTRRKRKRTDKLVLKYESKKRKKKNIEIKNKNIQLKIKWWDRHLKLKISGSKKHKKSKKYKQYVLKYSENKSEVAKPSYDVTPRKRKYVKQEKSPDNLVQTSIEKFFKITPSKEQKES